MELPIQAPAEGLTWTPRPPGNQLLITGAAGTVARLITAQLARSFTLTGIDRVPIDDPHIHVAHRADIGDTTLLKRLMCGADFVLHLATGVANGARGLTDVDIAATNTVLALAAAHGTRRVILASSNHVAGWHERQWLAGRSHGRVKPWDPPRPDGVYGAAKAHMEALGRFASDASGLPVSILRIGTMRCSMTLQELIDSEELPYLGLGPKRAERLTRSWLSGNDLVTMLLEELAAPEPYRLRYATSSPAQTQWDHTVYTG